MAESTTLSPWTSGTLDIHHIDTKCGSATFIKCPDGTTILLDCGNGKEDLDETRPEGSRRHGQRVARYAMHHGDCKSLDYMIATHVHPDHVGDVHSDKSASGDGFQLTGLSDVDHLIPATLVIDRAYPEYGLRPPLAAPFAANYVAWLRARQQAGRHVAEVDVGSERQITLKSPQDYPTFSFRTIAANGWVWTGNGEESRSTFPDLSSLPPEALPDENKCSIAALLSYGPFRYYSGGDLSFDTYDGRYPWMDIEAAVTKVAGKVDVALANHHAYFDACGADFVKHLDAQAYIIPAWHHTHSGMAQLQRLLGAWPDQKTRTKVFATGMTPLSCEMNKRFLGDMCSTKGHVVVRVARGGDSFRIFVLDSESESVVAEHGPLSCSAGP
ncbi:hypothetical protein M427DRAFT_64316 [Gonapodya prolifera JEL478]|uniref:Metallo-beta-lactamase domain-containing protein n=1 Tax=Gonapodya prolifera (strain JEL478) TaxID=1344416 RepID=A0A138ZYZ5_GONPJ|nr:hypothetical protein M427DRAFT_64316 [Gonapodya prolifera JEL478]|eukprot:KXS09353.1 hypothetical protein M427DRAFT_64316 [Gonapodya prolifera JEL478]